MLGAPLEGVRGQELRADRLVGVLGIEPWREDLGGVTLGSLAGFRVQALWLAES